MNRAHHTIAAASPRGFEIVEPVPGFLRFVFIVVALLFAIPTCST